MKKIVLEAEGNTMTDTWNDEEGQMCVLKCAGKNAIASFLASFGSFSVPREVKSERHEEGEEEEEELEEGEEGCCLTESQARFRMTRTREYWKEEQSRLVMHELSLLSTKDRSEINQSTKEEAVRKRKKDPPEYTKYNKGK